MLEFVAEQKERLDRFLVRQILGQSRTKIVQVVQSEGVRVDGVLVFKAGFELKPGQTVEITDIPETPVQALFPVDMELDVRFEDEHLIVVNKPRGLTVHPAKSTTGPTLVHGLLARSHGLSSVGGEFRPGIVHRLDKETTGLLIVAKTDEAHRRLSEQIMARSIERRYLAVAFGKFDQIKVKLQGNIGRHPQFPTLMAVVTNGRHAVTHVKQISSREDRCLLSCRLETGRTHQIRVHLATFGHPVKGDRLYAKDDWAEGSMQLHAISLSFTHPITHERVHVWVDPPADFESWDFCEKDVFEWN